VQLVAITEKYKSVHLQIPDGRRSRPVALVPDYPRLQGAAQRIDAILIIYLLCIIYL